MTDATAGPEPAPLDSVQRARDLLTEALAAIAMPTIEQLEALASLSDECRARAAGQPDALDRVLFLRRRATAQFAARVAQVRRGRRTEAAAC